MFGDLLYKFKRQLLVQQGIVQSYFEKPEPVNYPIDFVVTWVDDSDKEWLNKKNIYLAKAGSVTQVNNSCERYRNWDFFKYWFRAVEKYAPWVRRIFLITYGHVPSWLSVESEKLVVVRHEEFIPKEYLPTFSSITIELNLHRISGLSEHFVYFNDDMLLTAPVCPEDFFAGHYPRCCAIAMPLKNDFNNDSFNHQQFSNLGIFNAFWKGKISKAIRACPSKWFARQYGSKKRYNLSAYDEDYLLGLYFSHLAVPFCRNTFEQVWHDIPEIMDKTCMHKFRTAQDVFHQIITLWDVASNKFYPIEPAYYGKVFWCIPKQLQEISDIILNGDCRMVCLNDTYLITKDEFECSKAQLLEILNKKFPLRCSFEK